MTEIVLSRGELTRQEIIRAAHELFVMQGFHGTSMRQIADKANIALSGLYNHFKNKEDVFKQVFFEYHPYHDVLPALLAAEGDAVERFVRDAFKRMLDALGDRPDFMNLMFIEVVEFKSVHVKELSAILMPQQLEVLERVKRFESDRLREIPPLMLISSFLGSFISFILTEIIMSQHQPEGFTKNALDYFIDIYLHGILKDSY